MNTATYQSAAASLNSALTTAGITTLTISAVTNTVIGATTYPNLIDYIGYVLDSDNLKVNTIISAELAKYGAFAVVKSSARVVTPPSAPAGDHYITYSGYYISTSDLPQAEVQAQQFKSDVEAAAKILSTTIQNKSKPSGWSTASETSIVSITDPSPTTKTVVCTITVNLVKP